MGDTPVCIPRDLENPYTQLQTFPLIVHEKSAGIENQEIQLDLRDPERTLQLAPTTPALVREQSGQRTWWKACSFMPPKLDMQTSVLAVEPEITLGLSSRPS